MTRKKVKLAFINNDTERKASFKKRRKGLLKKAHEIKTLCDVDICAILYSPYHCDPEVFPSHDGVLETIKKFRELPEMEQTKKMMNQEGFLRQRIKKVDDQIRKIRKENRIREFTNMMYAMMGGQQLAQNMHPYDLNDLGFVISQRIKEAEAILEEQRKEGSVAVPQPSSGPVGPGGSNYPKEPLAPGRTSYFQEPRAPLMVPPISVVPPMADPSMVPPIMARPSFALPPPVPQPMNPPTLSPLTMTPQTFPPMVSQMISPMPQPPKAPRVVPPTPPPVTFPMTPLLDSPINPPVVESDYHQNNRYAFPDSPSLPEGMSFDDALMNFVNGTTSSSIDQDPSSSNNKDV